MIRHATLQKYQGQNTWFLQALWCMRDRWCAIKGNKYMDKNICRFFPNLKENTANFPNSKCPGPQSQKGVWEPCNIIHDIDTISSTSRCRRCELCKLGMTGYRCWQDIDTISSTSRCRRYRKKHRELDIPHRGGPQTSRCSWVYHQRHLSRYWLSVKESLMYHADIPQKAL